jgi:hypothetical protein
VNDPVAESFKEVRFDVADVSAERRSGVRNVRLQENLARETGGEPYDLTNVARLVDDIKAKPKQDTVTTTRPLWASPLWFMLVVPLMLIEWLVRKLVNLT